jgi:hypothetical protein
MHGAYIGRLAPGCSRNHRNRENGSYNESIGRVFTDYKLCMNAHVNIGQQTIGFPVTMETVNALIGFLRA